MSLYLDHLSLGIVLDDFVNDPKLENKVIENIRYCRKNIGKLFKIVFINKNLSENDVKDFFKRNERILFKLNTKITKHKTVVWFMIAGHDDNNKFRYKYTGSVLNGIAQYRKMVNILIKKERDESSNRR
jgi:hypothetical protein